jgi:threonyl-tRNA synthetase
MMHIARKRLYEISGHWEHYKEDMYAPIDVDGDQYVLKPMNCPHHIMVYKNDPHSYRDLPLRIAEMATVYRYEKSGELLGLSRVRGFTQNDAHIFCTLDQIDREFTQFFLLMKKIYKRAGIKDYWVRLSLHDSPDLAKYVHNEKMWKSAEAALEKALITAKVPYRKVKGEAAFYGPKADIMAKDVLGREYAISTIQIDFFLPERFDLEYVGKDGAKYRPVMIHRAILGSVERFIAFLLEHTGCDLPLWLAPRQIALITVADKHTAYAKTASAELRKNGFRVWELFDNESVGKKTREAQLQKLPYIAVIGDQEKKSKTITVRKSTAKKLTTFKLSALVEKMQKETR